MAELVQHLGFHTSAKHPTGEGPTSANVILQGSTISVLVRWKFGVGETCQVHRKDSDGKYMEHHIRV